MEIIFTKHALARMKKRQITEDEIINSIQYPEKISKRVGKFYVQKNIDRANIEVVYEKDKYIKVITVYYI